MNLKNEDQPNICPLKKGEARRGRKKNKNFLELERKKDNEEIR